MEKEHYYHMFANGDDARNFITDESEFKAAFNRFALCQHLTGISVLSFSVEDTHPHALLYGSYDRCRDFASMYEDLSIRSVVQKRGSSEGMNLFCEILQIDDEQYLKNVETYTITQATKDGKSVMPYDYLYGTGALYFRRHNVILPWLIDDDGHQMEPVRMGNLPVREQRILSGSRRCLPPDYLVCNGVVLPTNYVDVRRFENIYKTHNCFRAFMASSIVFHIVNFLRLSGFRNRNFGNTLSEHGRSSLPAAFKKVCFVRICPDFGRNLLESVWIRPRLQVHSSGICCILSLNT